MYTVMKSSIVHPESIIDTLNFERKLLMLLRNFVVNGLGKKKF